MIHTLIDGPAELKLACSPELLLMPSDHRCPVVFVSAHSGRNYPKDLLERTRLDPLALRRSEDCFVDELFAAAPRFGAPLLAATFPRVWCDANREPWELDPAMFSDTLPNYVNIASPRVAAGLGTIARIVSVNEPIYRQKLVFSDAEQRIRSCWMPFHAKLRQLIDLTIYRFGLCVLVDCHSMPSLVVLNVAGKPDVVLGDAFGSSSHPSVPRQIGNIFNSLSFSLRENEPYAGGYITRHYGSRGGPTHAIQLEINRGLYMNEASLERAPSFSTFCDRLSLVIARLAQTDWAELIEKKGRP